MSLKQSFSKALKELRFHHCQTSEHSAAQYPAMKKANPHTPILIREALEVEPRVWARYDFGKEKSASLKGLDNKAIESKIAELVQQAQ
ncbi:unnamed protein product [Aureobasidium vineae]|uniref:Ribosomal protein/NADH dehydrogenase domain-containing protein n=1 Tax=Aureobasidium vineae TaxID=2773715 RepID=A0A9N8P7P0_9PEZI|nr:unnamed protein product [Aureobasidium vineae]